MSDVAGVVCFLASPASAYVTGANLVSTAAAAARRTLEPSPASDPAAPEGWRAPDPSPTFP